MTENHADLMQIAELESRAIKLKELLERRTADRPMIIEFSGTPKAGRLAP